MITDRIRSIFDNDKLMALLGVRLVTGTYGHVVLEYTVKNEIIQEHGTCHGGVIFSLADAACGMAASGGKDPAVTQSCMINFLRPVPPGTTLLATARERSRSGRTIIQDVTVHDQDKNIYAELRGTARILVK